MKITLPTHIDTKLVSLLLGLSILSLSAFQQSHHQIPIALAFFIPGLLIVHLLCENRDGKLLSQQRTTEFTVTPDIAWSRLKDTLSNDQPIPGELTQRWCIQQCDDQTYVLRAVSHWPARTTGRQHQAVTLQATFTLIPARDLVPAHIAHRYELKFGDADDALPLVDLFCTTLSARIERKVIPLHRAGTTSSDRVIPLRNTNK